MWAILNTLNSSDTEDVTIDSSANWKAVRPLSALGIKVKVFVSPFGIFNIKFLI